MANGSGGPSENNDWGDGLPVSPQPAGEEERGLPDDVLHADRATLDGENLMPLYELDDVRAALGLRSSSYNELMESGDTEHGQRLQAILKRGRFGRMRSLKIPDEGAQARTESLIEQAPHFGGLGEILLTNVKAARAIPVPMFLHPTLLVGEPGVGKTWFLSRLAEKLELPFRSYSMAIATLGEGLQGSHPSWRNAAEGLVAKTLLRESVANPLIFVDELDKASAGSWNSDPFRPFYALLEPAGAKQFVDEYLGFPIDASHVLWVAAANDISAIPPAILDRWTVLEIPDPTREQRIAVIASIYAAANNERLIYFDPKLLQSVIDRLLPHHPRAIRIMIEMAMARAAADGRRSLRPDDIRPRQTHQKWHAGFC